MMEPYYYKLVKLGRTDSKINFRQEKGRVGTPFWEKSDLN
jgi:hypothetical protein